MSYSIDANVLLYASNSACAEYAAASEFLENRAEDPDLLCLTWPVLMAYQRIATHPAIFDRPLDPDVAWRNIDGLLALPRTRVLREEEGFGDAYRETSASLHVRGNLVPDAHIATILRQHGVTRIYTADADFRKFAFLEVINPIK
jgi:toxin-antitoxin system PIN domain toxin